MTIRLVFLTLLTLLFIQPSVTKAQSTLVGYCASNTGQPVVYFSAFFDTKIPSQVRRINTIPWASEFNAYLKGRFDLKSNQNFGGGCVGGRMVDVHQRLFCSYQRGSASKVENPTHASGWIVKLQPTTVGTKSS